jgi:hypothetical protein
MRTDAKLDMSFAPHKREWRFRRTEDHRRRSDVSRHIGK